jgi:hypothetical protein
MNLCKLYIAYSFAWSKDVGAVFDIFVGQCGMSKFHVHLTRLKSSSLSVLTILLHLMVKSA